MDCKVHRVRFYKPNPQPVNCVALHKINKNIALARGDASIEIWNISHSPLLVKYIPGVENGSIEALGWAKDRLLSTGLGGALAEWDLERLCLKKSVLLTGYAAWCLDVCNTKDLVAVGTEQGCINLYSTAHDDILYEKIFDKQEGRIMCCKFDLSGNVLVTGSTNTIRVWNVDTGHVTNRMSVKRHGTETIVWCLAILADKTIVSGDSHGRLTFWDSVVGDQIESFPTHKADILALAVSEDEKSIYCSGVDPLIVHFIKVNSNKQPNVQWVKNIQRHIHEHDVRALVLNEKQLISVGVDGYLTFSSYPPKWVMRIPPMIPCPRTAVCAEKKLLLLRYSNYIEVWKLGSYETNASGNVVLNTQTNIDSRPDKNVNKELEQDTSITIQDNDEMERLTETRTLKLSDKPLKLLTVQTKNKKQIRFCNMSPNGEFILYSTNTDTRLLKLEMDEDQESISVSKVSVGGASDACSHGAWSADGRVLVAHCAGELRAMHVDPVAGLSPLHTIQLEGYLSSTLLHLVISKPTSTGGAYLIAADTEGAISVWTQSKNKFEHYLNLPKYHCLPSALTVDQDECLIIVYVDQRIVEYDLRRRQLESWSGRTPPEWAERRSAVTAVAPHPARPAHSALVLCTDTALSVLDDSQNETAQKAKKEAFHSLPKMSLRVIPSKYLAGFHWLGDDEAVTVEVMPESIIDQLPPIFKDKKKQDYI